MDIFLETMNTVKVITESIYLVGIMGDKYIYVNTSISDHNFYDKDGNILVHNNLDAKTIIQQ